jgi:hypothetical protein
MGTLGQGDWCEHLDAQRGDFGPRSRTDIDIGIVYGEWSFAGGVSASAQMNGAYRHHAGDGSSATLNGDPMTLELLVEKRGNLTRYPAESEVAVLANPAHHISRLVQGTDHQPLH